MLKGREKGALRRAHVLWVALAMALAMFAVACGDDDSDEGSTNAPTTTEQAAAGEDNPFGATVANGEFGENYNPDPEILDRSIFGPDALPSDDMAKNVVLAAMARASADVDQDKALECWKSNDCETGTGGELTVGLADGFGGAVPRQIFKMEFIMQALSYPEIGRIIYTDANLDTQKAIADVRGQIAQGVDVMVSYPDAGDALLPAYREATKRDIPIALWANASVGEPGSDYLTSTGSDVCALGKAFAGVMNENLPDGGDIAFLGGTPGNTQSPQWQKCEEEELNPNINVVAKADTDWTRQGALEAMSGILSSHPDIKGVSYDGADAFLGAIRAFEAVNKPLDIVGTFLSDDNPLLCAWGEVDNPDFKVWTFNALLSQARVGLTAGMMAKQGADIPAEIIVDVTLNPVTEESCRDDIPANGSPSSLVPGELQARMFE